MTSTLTASTYRFDLLWLHVPTVGVTSDIAHGVAHVDCGPSRLQQRLGPRRLPGTPANEHRTDPGWVEEPVQYPSQPPRRVFRFA